MDDSSSEALPVKKPRKVATKRVRSAAASEGSDAADVSVQTTGAADALSGSGVVAGAAPIKKARSRKNSAKAAESVDAPELFRSGEDTASGQRETRADEQSFAPADVRREPEPVPASYSASEPVVFSTGDVTSSDDERPVFVPSGNRGGTSEDRSGDTFSNAVDEAGAAGGREGAEHADNAGAAHAPGGQFAHAPAGGAPGGDRREDRKSWWERKKEKKRQKWLERQQGGGGGGAAPHGQGGGAGHGGAGGQGRFGAPAGGRERNPAQPPPPSLQAPVGALPSEERLADFSAMDALAEELAKDGAPLDLAEIHAASAGELAQRLRALGETVIGMPARRALVEQLFAWATREKRAFREVGVLDIADAGHAFVVHRVNSYRLYPESTYLSAAFVKRHGLRRGQEVDVLVQPPLPGERCPAAVRLHSVMGGTPEMARGVTAFEELIPYYPTSRILVEAPDIHKDISMRAVDLLTPIGFGQRGLIVAPPRTGKTVLLQNIANSISHNFPEATLILLLIDERPEEVTDFKRHTKGEVVSSTFDEAPESHVHAAEMVIERARRLVELGKHVVILLDSITRLARAYNALAGNGGKTMSGGLESNALQRPKRFFGSARNIEGGGSLTILATALVDTNSRMDEVIFEEFKGTGNMELHLDRGLSDKRIFPAINIDRSGTRKEELIYHPDEMLRVYGLRRAMQGIPPVEAMDMFIQRLKKTRTNTEFLLSLNR